MPALFVILYIMLVFVISKREYDLTLSKDLQINPSWVCIGSVNSIEEVYEIANKFPCLTEVHENGLIVKSYFITCSI